MTDSSSPQYRQSSNSPTDIDGNRTFNSTRTDGRRHYPRDREGAKNEWQALVHHQAEMNYQIGLAEKELKNMRAQQLGQAYNQKLNEDIQRKEEQLQEKLLDCRSMDLKIMQFKNDLARQKLDKQTLQHILAESYENYMRDLQSQNNDEKQRRLEYELRELDENRKRMESERRKRAHAKQEYTNMAHDQIQGFNEKKNYEKQDHLRFQDEYNQQVSQNIQRDIMKEENYKNFYKMTADHQRHREDLHAQNVLSDYQRREQKVANTIDRGVAEAKQRAYEKEQFERRMREDARTDLRTTLTNQVGFKREQEDQQKQIKQRETVESVQKLQNYQNYLQDVKSQKTLQQKQYKDILDRQHYEWEEQQKANRMTKAEKKINFDDLQAYKNANPQLQSLVPGLQHTKYDYNGSPAMKKIFSSDTLTQTRQLTLDSSPTKLILNTQTSPTYRTSANSVLSNQLGGRNLWPGSTSPNNASSPVMNGHYKQDTINENIFFRPNETRNPITYTETNAKKQLYEARSNPISPNMSRANVPQRNSSFAADNHNPVTNPMPFNVQNPYILRQIQGVGRNSLEKAGYLAAAGNNSLVSS